MESVLLETSNLDTRLSKNCENKMQCLNTKLQYKAKYNNKTRKGRKCRELKTEQYTYHSSSTKYFATTGLFY